MTTGFTPNGPIDLVAPSPVGLPPLEDLLARLQSGQFDLSPVEELALRYIAQERENARYRTQAKLYRQFASGPGTVAAPLPYGYGRLSAPIGTTIIITNHHVPEYWVFWGIANGGFDIMDLTQEGMDPYTCVMNANSPVRVVLPGFRDTVSLRLAAGASDIYWNLTALSGYPADIIGGH